MIENILTRMKQWERLGLKEDHRGSKIIAHVPRDFPAAYLHKYFAPISSSDWLSYAMSLPEQLVCLYQECNGLDFFLGKLSVYGLRQHFARDLSAQFQPFDLKDHDGEHRTIYHPLKVSPDNRTFFASYLEDGSGVYVHLESEMVFRCLRDSSSPVNTWTNVKDFLETEFDRLASLHCEDGYLLEEDVSTTPKKGHGLTTG
jgi:hypothetical protein